MKTYEERINLIAEEMAIADIGYGDLPESIRSKYINNFKPLASIALKHMAEEFRRGYDYKYDGSDYEDLEERLIANGLIEPQTT